MRSDYIDVKPEKIESRTSSRTSSSSQYRSTDRLDSKSNSKIDKDSRSRSTKSSSSSSSTIRKRKSSDRRSRDRSRSSSKRHRTSKSDISNDKTSKSEKKVKKNNGTTLPELPNIIKVVKNSQKLVEQSSNSSPVAEIQAVSYNFENIFMIIQEYIHVIMNESSQILQETLKTIKPAHHKRDYK